MLPVLARFNGSPQVDERGDIVYSFPELQTTAGVRAGGGERESVPGGGGGGERGVRVPCSVCVCGERRERSIGAAKGRRAASALPILEGKGLGETLHWLGSQRLSAAIGRLVIVSAAA
jgi:hypothetical protein